MGNQYTTAAALSTDKIPTIEGLLAMMDQIKPPPPAPVVAIHPNNIGHFFPQCEAGQIGGLERLCGVRVQVSGFVNEFADVPVSRNRFIEFDSRDASWAVPLGLARMERRRVLYVFRPDVQGWDRVHDDLRSAASAGGESTGGVG